MSFKVLAADVCKICEKTIWCREGRCCWWLTAGPSSQSTAPSPALGCAHTSWTETVSTSLQCQTERSAHLSHQQCTLHNAPHLAHEGFVMGEHGNIKHICILGNEGANLKGALIPAGWWQAYQSESGGRAAACRLHPCDRGPHHCCRLSAEQLLLPHQIRAGGLPRCGLTGAACAAAGTMPQVDLSAVLPSSQCSVSSLL